MSDVTWDTMFRKPPFEKNCNYVNNPVNMSVKFILAYSHYVIYRSKIGDCLCRN
jgi:hypothetical protein